MDPREKFRGWCRRDDGPYAAPDVIRVPRNIRGADVMSLGTRGRQLIDTGMLSCPRETRLTQMNGISDEKDSVGLRGNNIWEPWERTPYKEPTGGVTESRGVWKRDAREESS